jgi:hypothetical protein
VGPFVHPLRNWPNTPPEGYLGQLTPEFQRWLSEENASLTRAECDWYHTTDLLDGTVIEGPWDLRGRESAYLGDVPLRGTRVLEAGPATGFLTFWMESQGAHVTCFEAGFDAGFEYLPPVVDLDYKAWQVEFMTHICRINNSWWMQHRDHKSSARIAYGDIYNLPADLGSFDASFFGSILLHLRDPFRALQQAAAHTEQTIIVTDVLRPAMDDPRDPVMRWGMEAGADGPNPTWWWLSSGAVTRMLWRLGFGTARVLHHSQRYTNPKNQRTRMIPQFTVVAEREAHRIPLPVPALSITTRARRKLARAIYH